MKLQCPYCRGFGVYKVKQHWWERLLKREQLYYCVDCEVSSVRSALVEAA